MRPMQEMIRDAESMAAVDVCLWPEMDEVFKRWDNEEWRNAYKRRFELLSEARNEIISHGERCVDNDKSMFMELQRFLESAYRACKRIDSSDWFEHWPDEVRWNVARAVDSMLLFSRCNYNIQEYKEFNQKAKRGLQDLANYECCN